MEELIDERSPRVPALMHDHRHVRYNLEQMGGWFCAAHPSGWPKEIATGFARARILPIVVRC